MECVCSILIGIKEAVYKSQKLKLPEIPITKEDLKERMSFPVKKVMVENPDYFKNLNSLSIKTQLLRKSTTFLNTGISESE
jgi:hypothetical protein